MFTDLPTAQAWLHRNQGQVVLKQLASDVTSYEARSAILPTMTRYGRTELEAINALYQDMGSARRP
jgi:hypothetical protein